MKTGTRTHASASVNVGYSQAIASHLRGRLRELTHLHSAEQGKGDARELMRGLFEEADKDEITLMVTVHPYADGLTAEQLEDWYARMGFFELQDEPLIMIRLPYASQPMRTLNG